MHEGDSVTHVFDLRDVCVLRAEAKGEGGKALMVVLWRKDSD